MQGSSAGTTYEHKFKKMTQQAHHPPQGEHGCVFSHLLSLQTQYQVGPFDNQNFMRVNPTIR